MKELDLIGVCGSSIITKQYILAIYLCVTPVILCICTVNVINIMCADVLGSTISCIPCNDVFALFIKDVVLLCVNSTQ